MDDKGGGERWCGTRNGDREDSGGGGQEDRDRGWRMRTGREVGEV